MKPLHRFSAFLAAFLAASACFGQVGAPVAGAQKAGVVVPCQIGAATSAPADITEDVLATCNVPSGLLGPNGYMRVTHLWTHTSSGNNKVLRIRFSGASGTQYAAFTVTAVATTHGYTMIFNRGATNSQVGTSTAPDATSGSAMVTSAVDTNTATSIVASCQKASSSETCTLEAIAVEAFPG